MEPDSLQVSGQPLETNSPTQPFFWLLFFFFLAARGPLEHNFSISMAEEGKCMLRSLESGSPHLAGYIPSDFKGWALVQQ